MNANERTRVRDCIKLIRDRNDGSLRDAAKVIGVSHACLSLVLSGNRQPGPRLIAALTKALGRHPDEMFTPGGQMLNVLPPALDPVEAPVPIPMLIWCPMCRARHLDVGEFATKPHHTHSCQSCGLTWRPAVVCTVGVEFLPGFKNEPEGGAP